MLGQRIVTAVILLAILAATMVSANPWWFVALLALAAGMALTGALHEDGLADVADGFGGGRDKMAKLAIMRDSRLGSYGVLALIFSVGLRWSALVALADPLAVGLALMSAGGAVLWLREERRRRLAGR